MREIKFRIKEGFNKEWYIGMPINFSKDGKTCTFQSFDGDFYSIFAKTDTLGQYTGLKDKNGIEIYEGDIVKWFNELLIIKYGEYTTTRESNSFGEHFKDVETFGWYGERQSTYGKGKGIDIDVVKYGEVIGNIYDNLELLEVKDGN